MSIGQRARQTQAVREDLHRPSNGLDARVGWRLHLPEYRTSRISALRQCISVTGPQQICRGFFDSYARQSTALILLKSLPPPPEVLPPGQASQATPERSGSFLCRSERETSGQPPG